jgi:hypothetical protein
MMGLEPLYSVPIFSVIVEEVLHYYNVVEEDKEDEDLRNLQMPKNEGECVV